MEYNALELRLEGLSSPTGEITLNDLTAIAGPLQQLTMRIGRHVAGQTGSGHNLAAVDRSTELRLTAVNEGSTCLQIGFGESDVLIDHEIERRTADGLFELWGACASGQRPDWVTPPIAESVTKLVEGLGRASSVSLGSVHRPAVVLVPNDVDREPWERAGELVATAETTMIGVLEMVDLGSGLFRLLDAVGNRIPLRHVQDPHDAASHIDQQVAAVGRAIREAGRFRGLDNPVVTRYHLPPEWTASADTDFGTLLAARPGPDPDGGADFTDEEFDAFMAAVKG